MEKINHLNDEEIIEAVIDGRDLDVVLRRHLLECSICNTRKEDLQGRLARFGKISRGDAPAIFRKPRIFENEAGRFRPAWRIRPAVGLGIGFVILILLLSPLTINRDKVFTQEVVYREMIQDEKFMTEIEKLEENPLPRTYVDTTDPGDDENEIQPPGATNSDGPNHDGGPRHV